MKIFIRNAGDIPDEALLTFVYIAGQDLQPAPDGNPKKDWRIPLKTLVRAADAGRLRVFERNRRMTKWVWLREYLQDPSGAKPGALPRRSAQPFVLTGDQDD